MFTTVGELVRALQDYPEDAPVRVGHQPNWPLRELVSTVGTIEREETEDYSEALEEARTNDDAEWLASLEAERRQEDTVWIVLGGHPREPESPYAPREIFDL